VSRYNGPRVKKMRSLGVDLPGLSRKTMERRPYPPGVHGPRSRRRPSEFRRQLHEKQKLRFNYGVGERQFRRLVAEAGHSKMPTGDKIVELLERRLDNVVFRAGFANTIPAARQLVNHGHFKVNGRRVDVPSIRVEVGDKITPRQRSRDKACIKEHFEGEWEFRPDWLNVDQKEMVVEVTALPTRDSVPFAIELQPVVEYYSKRL